jgi:hypothetical protein
MLTFNEAANLINRGRNGVKKLSNNTYLERVDDNTFAVRLHATNVVLIHSKGSYTLNSSGWRTVTTKARINEYSPARLYQEKGQWYLDYQGCSYVFTDGMKVNWNGQPVGSVRKAS